MFSIGGSEILVLGILALLLFGNKNLPENMKKMVKGLNEVKKVANDAQRSWHEIRDDVTRQIIADESADKAREELAQVKKALSAPVQGQAPLPRDDETAALPNATEEPEPCATVSSVDCSPPLSQESSKDLSGHQANSELQAELDPGVIKPATGRTPAEG